MKKPQKKKQIRNRPGLMEYLRQRLGVPSGNGPEYKFYCPFCIDRTGSESSKRKLTFNVAKTAFHCWRCGYGTRNLERLFRDLNGGVLRFAELTLVRGEVTIPQEKIAATVRDLLYKTKERKVLKVVGLPPEMVRLTQRQWDEPSVRLKRGINYLKQRGILYAQVEWFDIGYCPTGDYAQRLVFPVYQGGEQIYFTTRYAGKTEKKTLNPTWEEGYHSAGTTLLNFDGVVGAPIVSIVEGPFDMMAHAHAVALTGKGISDAQIVLLQLLAEMGAEEFVVSLDAGAGRDADNIYHQLLGRVPKVTVLLLDRGDPDERKDELHALMGTRRTLSLLDRVKGRFGKD